MSQDESTGSGTTRRLQAGSRYLVLSPAFDSYWRFAHERQAAFLRRIEGASPPWTQDPIIGAHRFTNVYRASDRVSQYLIRNVIYAGDQAPKEIFFRTFLFKLFNRIDTWESLRAALGDLTWREYSFERYNDALDGLFASGRRIYSAAYIMPVPAFGARRKHSNHLRLIEHMMAADAPARVTDAPSLARVFELLRGYPSLGDFLAFQLTIDLNYSTLTNFSEMDFVVAGPGARDGISKCFIDAAGLENDEIIRFMAEIADSQFDRLGLPFRSLWGRTPQLIDCQNVFCELSKYARLAHPDIAGISGRTRIKQKYTPRINPVPQWYPPKWGLNDSIARNTYPRSEPKQLRAIQQSFDPQFMRPS